MVAHVRQRRLTWFRGHVRPSAVVGKRLCLTAAHRAGEGLERICWFSRRRLRRVRGPLGVSRRGVGHEFDVRLAAGAGERGVSPLAGEVLRAADHDGCFNGGALAGVAGDGVGVLQVLGDVGRREGLLAAVGAADDDALAGGRLR